MEHVILSDNWKKESKVWLEVMIFVGILAIAVPLAFYFKPISEDPLWDAIRTAIVFFMLFCLSLYGFLYSTIYLIKVTEEKITRKTLFGKYECYLNDIQEFTYKRYNKKSELYLFILTVHEKRIKIYTRFYKEMEMILNSYRDIVG